MSNNNRIKVKIKRPQNGVLRAELTMERRASYWGPVTERRTFTLPLATLERALRDATIEAPWRELLKR